MRIVVGWRHTRQCSSSAALVRSWVVIVVTVAHVGCLVSHLIIRRMDRVALPYCCHCVVVGGSIAAALLLHYCAALAAPLPSLAPSSVARQSKGLGPSQVVPSPAFPAKQHTIPACSQLATREIQCEFQHCSQELRFGENKNVMENFYQQNIKICRFSN